MILNLFLSSGERLFFSRMQLRMQLACCGSAWLKALLSARMSS
jgi:hypothetical protein